MKLAIYGCCGRVGRMIVNEALKANQLASAITKSGDPMVGKNVSNITNNNIDSDIKIKDHLDHDTYIDCLIDFTNPESSLNISLELMKKKIPHVIGTTGFDQYQIKYIKDIAKYNRIFLSYNMSFGINILIKALEVINKYLDKDYDISIIEMHHKNKKDAPSGTAKLLAETIDNSYSNISFNSIRAGDIIGEHEIIFANNDEIIKFSHQAMNRLTFAKNALKAAAWLLNQRDNGLYNMQDLISSN